MVGLDLGSQRLAMVVVAVVVLALDLFAAGGAMTGGVTAGMMGTPWGWGGFLLVLVVVLLLLAGRAPS